MKNIIQDVYSKAWAIREETLTVITQRNLSTEDATKETFVAALKGRPEFKQEGYTVVNGIAVIPIHGVIMKNPDFWDLLFGAVSTGSIQNMVNAAIADPTVQALALDIDSPGGTVAGTAETADLIYSARSKKKIYAFASGQMASGAYWIGSSADKIYATKTTEVGSIGVYTTMIDMSVLAHNAGIKFEIVKAGKYKALGHPAKPLSEEEKQVAQTRIDDIFSVFVDSVARNRGLSMDKVMEFSDGRVWIAEKAADLGLIDGVDSLGSFLSGGVSGKALSVGSRPVAGSETNKTGTQAGKSTNKEEHVMDLKDLTLEEFRAGRPDLAAQLLKEGREAGISEGKVLAESDFKTKTQVEKERVNAINSKAKEIGGVEAAALLSVQSGDSVEVATERMKEAKLKAIQTGAPGAMGGGNTGGETKDHLTLAREYQAAHKCSMEDALLATAPKRETK